MFPLPCASSTRRHKSCEPIAPKPFATRAASSRRDWRGSKRSLDAPEPGCPYPNAVSSALGCLLLGLQHQSSLEGTRVGGANAIDGLIGMISNQHAFRILRDI